MSGGEQQMVAIGRALMSAPNMLLLDEPSLGLSPLLCGELFQALARIRETGVGILLVEQNAEQSLEHRRPRLSDRDRPHRRARARAQCAARTIPAVQRAYLGAGEVHAALARGRQRWRNNKNRQGERHETRQPDDRRARRCAADGRTFDRIDPFTGEVASRAAAASVADAIAAADAAAAAFPAWAALGPSARRAMLLKAADLLDAKRGGILRADDRRMSARSARGAISTPFRRRA